MSSIELHCDQESIYKSLATPSVHDINRRPPSHTITVTRDFLVPEEERSRIIQRCFSPDVRSSRAGVASCCWSWLTCSNPCMMHAHTINMCVPTDPVEEDVLRGRRAANDPRD